MAFIEVSAPQKIIAKTLSVELFCGTGFYKRREINCQEKKKDELSPAIGKNYINKKASFLLLFIYRCFYLSLIVRNPIKIVTEKEDKKLPHIYLLLLFIFFYGRKTNPSFLTATPSISE